MLGKDKRGDRQFMLTAIRDRVQPRNTDVRGYNKERRAPREARKGEKVKEKRDRGRGMGPRSGQHLIPVAQPWAGPSPPLSPLDVAMDDLQAMQMLHGMKQP